MFSLVMEMELLSDHRSLKEAGTQFYFRFTPDTGIFVNNTFKNKISNKNHLGKKSIFLVLPFFPVSIWKNSGQWALTVCPTADEGQQLMLSHIPAHLPGEATTKHYAASPSDETPWNFSQQWNTMKHLQATKHHARKHHAMKHQGPRQLWEHRCSVLWKPSWMRQSKSCWDLLRPG